MRSSSIDLEDINYAKTALTVEQVEDIVTRAGSVAAVLNTRHTVAKANDWATKPPSASVFAKAAAKEPNLLRRPILIDGDRVIVGFNKTEYAKLKK